MRSFEEELADWQARKERYELDWAAHKAETAAFDALQIPDDEAIMVRRITSLPAGPPARPTYHSWPPPPDADLSVRFERALGHLYENLGGGFADPFRPVFAMLTEAVAEVARLRAIDQLEGNR